MNKIFIIFFSIIIFFGCSNSNNIQSNQTNNQQKYGDAKIDNIKPLEGYNFQLPVKNYEISSLFGPRLKASENLRYDFHRGIDFHHDQNVDVFSIQEGKIFRLYYENDPKNPYKNSGNTVIIQHVLPKDFEFHGKNFDTIYSLYTHLDQIEDSLKPGASIAKGEKVGTMGTSGTTVYNHLHFEIRVGTTCSREYQLRNPNKSCAKKIPNNGDPHINPYVFLPNNIPANIQLETSMNENNALSVKISTNRDYTGLNKVVVTQGQISKTIDLNLRKNIDPNNIDNNIFNGVKILPRRFSTRSGKYELGFEFENFDTNAQIQIYDVHNTMIYSY